MTPTPPSPAFQAPALQRRLLWLIGIRMLVVASVAVPFLLYDPAQIANPTLQLFIALTSVLSLVYIVLLRVLRRWPETQAYIQLCGDLVVITTLIYKLDAASFSLLYIFIISVAAVFLSRTGVLVIAGLAYLLYVPEVLGWVPSIFDWDKSFPPLPGDPAAMLQLIYKLVVHLVGFYGVAILTSYLARDAARSEERLRRQELDLAYLQGLYGDVIQSMSSGLVITDLAGEILSVNRSGEQILRRKESELAGGRVDEAGIFSADHWSRYLRKSERVTLRSEGECIRGDGTRIHLGFTLTHLRDAEGTHQGYILLFQDLSDWQALQEQLRIQDRMAAIGQMAAGLAHEVGNPLAAISGSVQLLAGSMASDADSESHRSQSKLAEIILKESHRLDRTVKAFLQFAKPSERNLATFDVAAMLAEDIQLLRNSGDVEAGHEIEADLVPESAMIQADFDQVSQIFWNLARNALQAMPGGGRLTIVGRVENGYYRMQFRDTGIGMTEEERARLFHPFKSFFDGGTGLGMAIVYRIVKEHGGEIRVDSEPHSGSSITVDLPVRQTEYDTERGRDLEA